MRHLLVLLASALLLRIARAPTLRRVPHKKTYWAKKLSLLVLSGIAMLASPARRALAPFIVRAFIARVAIRRPIHRLVPKPF